MVVEDEGGIDLRMLMALVLRRKWIIIGVTVLSVLAGAIITIRSPKIYQAHSKVLIELSTPKYLNQVREVYDPGAVGYFGQNQFYKTQFEVIKGEPVAERVVAMLGISGPGLAERLRAEGVASVEDQVAGDVLRDVDPDLRSKIELIGFASMPSREEMAEALERFDAVSFAKNRVDVSAAEDSRIVRIKVTDTDPERAALFANAVTDAYAEYNLDLRTSAARSAVDWLSGQLSDLKRKLDESELKLYEFKKESNIVSVSLEDRQSMISQTLTELNSRLSEVRARRIELEALRDQVQRARNEGLNPDSIDVVATSTTVQLVKTAISELKQNLAELSTRYTAKHPRIIETKEKIDALRTELEEEIQTLLTASEERYRTMRDTETRLGAAIEKTKSEALEINKREIVYNKLKREAENYAGLYEVVLKRQKETDLTTLLNVNNVRKFEAAKAPRRPIKPNARKNMTFALFIGLVLGGGLAFLVDMLDNTVKSQKQVEELVRVPFLGIVPMIKVGKGPRDAASAMERDCYILDNPRSAVAECTRTIRTNLMFMSPDEPARTLVVTSSSPREGKSTTAINLAIVTAQSGKRTLIVDTDMRRPRLHKSFGVDNDIGISSYIVGEAPLDRVVRPSGVDGLDLMTCGPIPPNPAELLHTESFEQLLGKLRERYDRVIFDSPPVTAVTDSLVLSSMMDGVVLVIHANSTTLHAAQVARRRIEDVGGRIFGAVLNDVDLDDRRTSEYYQQYYYYYRSPYVDEEQLKKEARG